MKRTLPLLVGTAECASASAPSPVTRSAGLPVRSRLAHGGIGLVGVGVGADQLAPVRVEDGDVGAGAAQRPGGGEQLRVADA